MLQRRCTIALTVALLATGLAGAQSLEGILTKIYDARGGLDKIKSVESVRMSGTLDILGMTESPMPITMEWKRPDKLRVEFTMPQGTVVQCHDGETVWAMMSGMPGPTEITGDQADSLRRQSDLIDGPLVDWKEKGNTVEYLGEDELDGVAVHKVKVVRADGTEATIYLDAGNFLAVWQNATTMAQGMETEVDTFIGDYKEVGGLMMAHNIKTELIDMGMTQNITMDSIEFNVEIADDRFAMPEAAPAGGDEGEDDGNADHSGHDHDHDGHDEDDD